MGAAQAVFISVVETDTFCESCGFNLMTQRIWREETLGLLVCRCPECGRHHSAQSRSTAGTVWMHRLGTLGLMIWGLVVLLVVAGMYFGQIGMQAVAEERLTWQRLETKDGVEVTAAWTTKTFKYSLASDATRELSVNDVRYVRYLVPFLPGGKEPLQNQYSTDGGFSQAVVVIAIMALLIYLGATVLATATWFWRPWARLVWLLIPLLALGTVEGLQRSQRIFSG